jgi:hypothetical protein
VNHQYAEWLIVGDELGDARIELIPIPSAGCLIDQVRVMFPIHLLMEQANLIAQLRDGRLMAVLHHLNAAGNGAGSLPNAQSNFIEIP